MTRHFITFLVLALLSYGLLYALHGEPDVPLFAWVLIWLGVAVATAVLHKIGELISRVWRRAARK
jgi:hypothetical protein